MMRTYNRFVLASTLSTTLLATLGCQPVIEYLRGFRAYAMPSSSMEQTIYTGETFLCDLNAYKFTAPSRGDVVIFSHKNLTDHQDLVLVKRLIGLPGDKLEGKDGVVTRNGIPLVEPYAEHVGLSQDNLDTFGPVTVAPNEVFVLGDNRNHSLDSRLPGEFGAVNFRDIRAKAISILKSEHGRKGQVIQ